MKYGEEPESYFVLPLRIALRIKEDDDWNMR